MKGLFNVLQFVIRAISLIVFVAGAVFSILGCYEFIHAFSYLSGGSSEIVGFIAINLLRSVDLFLIAIVLFVFSLGLLVLFNNDETRLPDILPSWLRIKDFIQLKVLLWEAILTTLVVSYLAGLAERRMSGEHLAVHDLIIPGAILILAVSLFLLKHKEKE